MGIMAPRRIRRMQKRAYWENQRKQRERRGEKKTMQPFVFTLATLNDKKTFTGHTLQEASQT